MIAPRTLPPAYAEWNRRWGAPFGRPGYASWPLRGTRLDARRRGPFAHQGNNSTREFEYPWAYEQVSKLGPGKGVVDVGGSLGGLQFVLAGEGYDVTNVDPGVAAEGRGWEVTPAAHRRLCEVYAAPVRLVTRPLQDAGLPGASADAVLCVSAMEHFSPADLAAVAEHVPRVLRPGGVAVLTVDLFLDLAPFTDRESNEFGRNVDLRAWLARAGLELAAGDPAELNGFPEFSAGAVLRDLSRFHVGRGYPALAQCLVGRKP
jgi:SAM-dependent methyltransferase